MFVCATFIFEYLTHTAHIMHAHTHSHHAHEWNNSIARFQINTFPNTPLPPQIMTANNPQQKHVHGSSLNERERKLHVQKINKTNELMLERLSSIRPILNVKKFDDDFERHKKIGGYLKKKRYGPATLKPLSTQPKFGASANSTFDAESYISHFGPESDKQSPITSMAEFRKAVISSKRMSGGQHLSGTGAVVRSSSQGNMHTTQGQGQGQGQATREKEIRFEMTHEPSS